MNEAIRILKSRKNVLEGAIKSYEQAGNVYLHQEAKKSLIEIEEALLKISNEHKMEYIILFAPSFDQLTEAVNEKIKEGFKPVGGVTIFNNKGYQAMFKDK